MNISCWVKRYCLSNHQASHGNKHTSRKVCHGHGCTLIVHICAWCHSESLLQSEFLSDLHAPSPFREWNCYSNSTLLFKVLKIWPPPLQAWCSEIGSLTSLDACNSGASSDVREPISLHQAVCILSHTSVIRKSSIYHVYARMEQYHQGSLMYQLRCEKVGWVCAVIWLLFFFILLKSSQRIACFDMNPKLFSGYLKKRVAGQDQQLLKSFHS